MKNEQWRKHLVIGIIVLFIGAGVVPSISGFNTKFTDVKSEHSIENINPTNTLYLESQPDLIIYDVSAGKIGDQKYESPSSITQIGGSLYTLYSIVYIFVIEIQNDGDKPMNCTIQTTQLSGWTFPASRLIYPYGGYTTMPLTSTPQQLDMIQPHGSRMMFLTVLKFPFTTAPVQVELDAASTDNTYDSIIVHT